MDNCGMTPGAVPDKGEINIKTVTGKLRAIWESQPERTAMVFYDDDAERLSLTHGEVQTLSMKCASLLCYHGVKKGDVVCNTLYNSMEREIVNFGILLAGAVVMHGDVIDDKGRHFWAPLVQAGVKFVVLEPDLHTPAWKMFKLDVGQSDADIEKCTRNVDAPDIQKVFKFRQEHRIKKSDRSKVKSGFDIIREHQGSLFERVSSHDPAAICVDKCAVQKHYKMVLRTHGEMCHISSRIDDMLHCTADDVIYCDFPLSWLPGLPYCHMSSGCTMVKSTLLDCPPRKVVAETWSLIETEKCTMAALQPPMIQMLSSHCEDMAEPHWTLRLLSTSGWVRQSVMDAIGPCTQSIVICYSRIETGLIARLPVNTQTASVYSEGCMGDLSNPVRTRLDQSGQSNETVKATPVGEILLDGLLVAKEYLNDPNLTKSSYTEDGFLLTGDIGFYDENKQLFVLGRKVDAIIRGNVPIFPREIEEKVNQCPGIWKVKVVSLKDDKGIIQMCACVIPRNDDAITIDRVKEFCRYQLGGTFDDDNNPHMPTYIFFFDSFPTVHGRVNRRMLAYMASEILQGNTRLQS
ncbi:2-succinylbenzoate--CoA ligase [Aplysia californica]|uniref:Medium-chain acyl-CoA ligase ACSF2, mitochondrial n=1 Tax=Aplysia californica TaxID=6500 RepID=A0ABM1A9H9_APLCA|nr:2-succinylbenzoate--CoA ligase [Aplysia californica]